jgi:hypothetical protein
LQLPEGAIVDIPLTGHGDTLPGSPCVGATGPDYAAVLTAGVRPPDFAIVFSPNGSVERTNYLPYPTTPNPPTSPIVGRSTAPVTIMIGKREKLIPTTGTAASPVSVATQFETDAMSMPADAQRRKYNFKDPDNFWVIVNPSGTIVTGEVAASTPSGPGPYFADCLKQSRNIARSGANVGGR